MKQQLMPQLEIPSKTGIRATAEDMPSMAFHAAQLVEGHEPGEMVEVALFRPKDVASDKLVAAMLRTSADYVTSYIDSLARRDPDRARLLADNITIPLVRVVRRGRGTEKPIVEVVTVSEYFRRRAVKIGELASRKALEMLTEKRPQNNGRAGR